MSAVPNRTRIRLSEQLTRPKAVLRRLVAKAQDGLEGPASVATAERMAANPVEPKEAVLTFRCNICSTWVTASVQALGRETPNCPTCSSSARLRAMARSLALAVTGEPCLLQDLPGSLRGIGLSDQQLMSRHLARHLDYHNTFFHQEPLVDVTSPAPTRLGSVDFLLSSDVFEHVLPPVQAAFDGAFAMLRPGGWLILSVPHVPAGMGPGTVEHFPNLHEWSVETDASGHRTLVNVTTAGVHERFDSLVFHGGSGETLEMRLFEERSILTHLAAAGFENVSVRTESDLRFGICWGDDRASVPIIAQRPMV